MKPSSRGGLAKESAGSKSNCRYLIGISSCRFHFTRWSSELTIENQKKALTLVSEKLNFSKNLKNFFFLLIEKRRIFFVTKIIESFLKLCMKKRGELKASLISSKDLSETELDNISQELSSLMGSTIKFDYKIDKELIGGLKLQLGSFMIDTSIKNKLKKLEQRMLED